MTSSLPRIVTIENVRYQNRATLPNANDLEPLYCVIPDPEMSDLELWELFPTSADRYQIRHLKFQHYAVARYPFKDVGGAKDKCWWFIERVDVEHGQDTYVIRHNDQTNLCWYLDSGSNNAPVELRNAPLDHRCIWKIAQHPYPVHAVDSTIPPQAHTSLDSRWLAELAATFHSTFDGYIEAHPSTAAAAALKILGYAFKMIIEHTESSNQQLDLYVSNLLVKIIGIYEALCQKENSIVTPAMEELLNKIARQILECVDYIMYHSEKVVFWKRLGKDTIRETRIEIDYFIAVLNELSECIDSSSRRGDDGPIQIHRIVQEMDLSSLDYATGAGINTSKRCLPGTRIKVLSKITDFVYATGDDAKQIFWLSGTAGKGKSAIAHTIAGQFHRQGALGSCFCFDRTRHADRRHEKIWSTIARDLADHDPLIRRELARVVIHGTSDIKYTEDPTRQWERLVSVLRNVGTAKILVPVLIIIDALDESGETGTRAQILRMFAGESGMMSQFMAKLPSNIRILVTSRPLPDIQDALDGLHHIERLSLDNIPPSWSEHDDVKLYIAAQLTPLRIFQDNDFQALALKSNGVFEWARLACFHIKDRNSIGPKARFRFDNVVSVGSVSGIGLLDQMYKHVLKEVMPKKQRKHVLPIFCSVMGHILTSLEPLSMTALVAMREHFPREDDTDQEHDPEMEPVLRLMGALLIGVEDDRTPIRPLHASFYDFLMAKDRSGEFYIDADAAYHYKLAFASFHVMKAELRFNICQLESSYLPNSAVVDIQNRIEEYISPQLQYSCRFWAVHYAKAVYCSDSLSKEVELLFSNKNLLFWLETLSLTNHLTGVVAGLSSVMSCFVESDSDNNIWLRKAIMDTNRFVQMFASTMLRSTPHLYLSALPFAPTSSWIFQTFTTMFPGAVTIAAGSRSTWPSLQKIIHYNASCTAISPDGRKIVSGSSDGTVRVWDADTGLQVGSTLRDCTGSITSVTISQDGRRIVSGSWDGTVRVWDADTGRQICSTFQGHGDEVTSVVISQDERRIVSGSRDGTVGVWDADTGLQIGFSLQGHTNAVTTVAISPDGRRIVSGSRDRTVRMWDVDTRLQIGTILQGHRDMVTSVAISQDGRRIVSGSDDGTVCVCEAVIELQHYFTLQGHTGLIASMAISLDGRRIACGLLDGTVCVWDTDTGLEIGTTLQGHTGPVTSVTISQDGRRIVSGSRDHTVCVWDAGTRLHTCSICSTFQGRTDSVTSVTISQDGRRIVSGSRDHTVCMWDADTRLQIGSTFRGHTSSVTFLAISQDGQRIVSGSEDGTVCVWDAHTGFTLRGHTSSVTSVAISQDGRRIVSSSRDGTIRVWNADTGKQIGSTLQGHRGSVASVAISQDGQRIVSGSWDCTVYVWDADTGLQACSTLQDYTGSVASMAISLDGRRIACGSWDGTVRVWDADTGLQICSTLQGHIDAVTSVAISKDMQRIVSGSRDRTVRVWDTTIGLQIGSTLCGHTGSVTSVTISQDGRRIVSGSEDGTVRMWDMDSVPNSTDDDLPAELRHLRYDSIYFSSNPTHALQSSTLFIDISHSPESFLPDPDGWVTGPGGRLLFKIPMEFVDRSRMYVPGNTLVIPNDGLQLDLSRFAHGESWHMCYDPNRR
ncbi:uncharacterized protein FIBRA_00578 [Fibroporia radiculosa]|uniref:Nephrocystin 3-like N-terminal domain-containing protein n=1 Tax=Fibroporia radiculosa TaxID=599839 RepID=J4HRU3_9APHY|nr:uncharacterized protein FIBRA_00578 [Fibroporia radiculosa]CCL98577.1 predicted protein [Fibroporia radiculosa]